MSLKSRRELLAVVRPRCFEIKPTAPCFLYRFNSRLICRVQRCKISPASFWLICFSLAPPARAGGDSFWITSNLLNSYILMLNNASIFSSSEGDILALGFQILDIIQSLNYD